MCNEVDDKHCEANNVSILKCDLLFSVGVCNMDNVSPWNIEIKDQ